MNAAATAVLGELSDIKIAYGLSDEFRYIQLLRGLSHRLAETDSFILDKTCSLFNRRER